MSATLTFDELQAEHERMRNTLIDLECAFSKTAEIPETPFTLHALDAIRRSLGTGQIRGRSRLRGANDKGGA